VGGGLDGLKGGMGRLVCWPVVRKEGGPANFKNRVKAQTAQVGFSYLSLNPIATQFKFEFKIQI
jgi:hypothetical protein